MRASPSLETEVRALDALDLDGLRSAWRSRFGPAPKLRSVELLRLMLAWRIQAKATGGLDFTVRRALERRGATERQGRSLGLGAVLRRDWQGQTIEVVVEEAGFRHAGRLYPSLSAVAEAVTGTRWSGPRFFGLKGMRA
ncbi:DUF2924 domain-containing protein [Phreatobacter sp.]|uniref:DUF2924 domain-containing protein n=1 Tax=Phreatobacter sp. TaxID=1966341 RepID=UPI003F70400A